MPDIVDMKLVGDHYEQDDPYQEYTHPRPHDEPAKPTNMQVQVVVEKDRQQQMMDNINEMFNGMQAVLNVGKAFMDGFQKLK